MGSLAVLIYKRVNALGVIEDDKNSQKSNQDPIEFIKTVLEYYGQLSDKYIKDKDAREKAD